MNDEKFLVTGARGCIGAWVVRCLIDEGVEVVAADVGASDHRLRHLLDEGEMADLRQLRLDITDREGVAHAIGDGGFTNLIHLAALQVPFCKADPIQGALVNVVGTANLMESFHASASLRGPFVYASSIAAYAPLDAGDAAPEGRPRTLYGVYKVANEHAAAVYADDHGLASIGLRPHVVYGVGRDQGMTSSPTVAMLRAAAGEGTAISYSGGSQMQFAPDVARVFIASARSEVPGAHVFNVGGPSSDMIEVVAAIDRAVPALAGRVTIAGDPLPFPPDASDLGLSAAIGEVSFTALDDGVARTIHDFERLLADGQLSL